MPTLVEILANPRFEGLELLTQDVDLDQDKIESVEVTETPDVENHIPAGVLLLTTAMYFKDRQLDLIPFIDSLIRAGSIGLCIKTSRFLGQVHPEVIDYANRNNFPLIKIPSKYSLGIILHQLLSEVWGVKHDEMSFALDIQQQFTKLLLHDASIDNLVQEFSQILHSAIVFMDPFGEIMATSKLAYPGVDRQSLQETLQGERDNGLAFNKVIFPEGEDTKGMEVTFMPVHLFDKFPHYLVILEPKEMPYPISHFAVEQASLVLSFALYKSHQINLVNFTNEADFFQAWIQQDTQEPLDHSKFKYLLTDYYQVICVNNERYFGTQMENNLHHREVMSLVAIWLEDHLHDFIPKAKVIFHSTLNELLILIQGKPQNLNESLKRIHQVFYDSVGIKLYFSLGGAVRRLEDVRDSYTQARFVLEDRRMDNKRQPMIQVYQYRGLKYLFNQLSNNEIRFFCESTLGELAYPEDANTIDLRETLKAYLDYQCQIATTARQLYIHRNTVKYRIQRCQEILGVDVESPDNSLNLRLALELSKE